MASSLVARGRPPATLSRPGPAWLINAKELGLPTERNGSASKNALLGAARQAKQRHREHDGGSLYGEVDPERNADHRDEDLVQRVCEPVDQQEIAHPEAQHDQQELLGAKPIGRVLRFEQGLVKFSVEKVEQHRY